MAREDLEEFEDDEEEEITSEDEAKRIRKIMHKLDLTKPEDRSTYQELSELLANMTESDRNEKQAEQIIAQKFSWIVPAAIQGVSSVVTSILSVRASRKSVDAVLGYENNGGIVKTAATGFINKPR